MATQARRPRAHAGGVALAGFLLALAAALPAGAADEVAAPEITNPAIRQLLDGRNRRLPELRRLQAAEILGESNRALVEVRDLGALAPRDRAAVEKLVRAENADRERMFEEVAAATGSDLSQLPRIRAAYAQTLRQKARPGDWIQLPDGTWRRKE